MYTLSTRVSFYRIGSGFRIYGEYMGLKKGKTENMVFHNPILHKSIKSISRYLLPLSCSHFSNNRWEKSTHLDLIIHGSIT